MNPFLPWLPMYRPGTLPDRPMWRRLPAERQDGAGAGGVPLPTQWERCDGARAREDQLLDIERASPVPAPPPMEGQVWVGGPRPTGLVARVETMPGGWVVFWGGTDEERHYGAAATGLGAWPPERAVLVAGPTPWGRDVPWHPAGWRPAAPAR
jgi:hypothetical protein